MNNNILEALTIIEEEENRTKKDIEIIRKAKKEIERLNSIIKEAREYIEKESWFSYKDNEEVIDRTPVEHLLEILRGDKE